VSNTLQQAARRPTTLLSRDRAGHSTTSGRLKRCGTRRHGFGPSMAKRTPNEGRRGYLPATKSVFVEVVHELRLSKTQRAPRLPAPCGAGTRRLRGVAPRRRGRGSHPADASGARARGSTFVSERRGSRPARRTPRRRAMHARGTGERAHDRARLDHTMTTDERRLTRVRSCIRVLIATHATRDAAPVCLHAALPRTLHRGNECPRAIATRPSRMCASNTHAAFARPQAPRFMQPMVYRRASKRWLHPRPSDAARAHIAFVISLNGSSRSTPTIREVT
jgi:hypothetical protein